MVVSVKCPQCTVKNKIDGFLPKKLTEEAVLVCPVCGTEFSLGANIKKRGGGQEAPGAGLGAGPAVRGALPPVSTPGGGGGFVPGATPAVPGVPRPESAQAAVYKCKFCLYEWVDYNPSCCPNCEKGEIQLSEKSVTDKVEQVLGSYTNVEDMVSSITERVWDRVWRGSLFDFSTKISAIKEELDIDSSFGEIVGWLHDSDTVRTKNNKIQLDIPAAKRVIVNRHLETRNVEETPQITREEFVAHAERVFSKYF